MIFFSGEGDITFLALGADLASLAFFEQSELEEELHFLVIFIFILTPLLNNLSKFERLLSGLFF